MTKPVLTLRNVKNLALTYDELDTNFTNLRDSTINFTGDAGDTRSMDLNDTTDFEGAHNIRVTVDEATQKIVIDNTLSDYTQEPMGFVNRTDSTISFNSSTRVFTIAPASTSYTVFCTGEQYTKSSSETITITNTTGLYYVYYNASAVLSLGTTFFTLSEQTPIAYVYWNATTGTGLLADERHGIVLDWRTHEYLHRTRGAAFANGFIASNYTTTGTGANDADAQLDISNGTFFDEDIDISVTHSNTPTANSFQQDLQGPARIPVLYHSGAAGAWVSDAQRDYPVKNGTSLVTYNLNTAGTWTTPDATSTHYVAYWIVATNFVNTPVISIMGQRSDNKLSDAINNNTWASLDLTNFPNLEFRPLYRLIFRTASTYTNTPKAYIAQVDDFRFSTIIPQGGISAGVQSVTGTAGNISSTGGQDPVLDLVATAVTPGTYYAANITVDAYGRLTSATSGTAYRQTILTFSPSSPLGYPYGEVSGTITETYDPDSLTTVSTNTFTLGAGTYHVAVSNYNGTFGSNWKANDPYWYLWGYNLILYNVTDSAQYGNFAYDYTEWHFNTGQMPTLTSGASEYRNVQLASYFTLTGSKTFRFNITCPAGSGESYGINIPGLQIKISKLA